MWNREKKNYKVIVSDLNYADFEINELEWRIRNAMTDLNMKGMIESEPRKGNEQPSTESKCNKQITYVIENSEGQLFAGVTTNDIWWTGLIIKATLFDNQLIAEKANEEAKGIIKRMNYTLESIKQ